MRVWTTAFSAILLLAASAVGGTSEPLIVSQRMPLNKEMNGVDGWLQVMTDARLSEKLRAKMWGEGDWAFVIPENDALFKVFSAAPPRNAELQIANLQGQVLANEVLERPLAKVEQKKLQAGRPTFLVTVDYSTGMGSYAGPATMLLDVVNADLHWLEAMNADTGKREMIRLPKTLKSDWRLSPTGAHQDILQVLCRPDDFGGSGAFSVSYVRYHFDEGAGWQMRKRVKKGFWESEDPFPQAGLFP